MLQVSNGRKLTELSLLCESCCIARKGLLGRPSQANNKQAACGSRMQRIFGKKKEEGPAPSLADAGGRVDARVKGLDDKIKGLDQELLRYKTALQKAKGPTAVNIKVRTARSSLALRAAQWSSPQCRHKC
jgi:hypothetical protein